MTEQQLLRALASLNARDIPATFDESIALERELAKLYMPQLDETATEAELHDWGMRFKSIVKQKLETI